MSTLRLGGYTNDADSFCYICGRCTKKKDRRNITPFIKNAYFGVKLGDQDKSFYAVKINGLTSKTRSSVDYPSLPSAIQPVPHSDELPIPTFHGFQLSEREFISSSEDSERCEDFVACQQNDEPQLFTQAELNDLVRELDLPKSSAELPGSRLKEKNTLAAETKVSFYRYREKHLLEFFKMEEKLFCDVMAN